MSKKPKPVSAAPENAHGSVCADHSLAGPRAYTEKLAMAARKASRIQCTMRGAGTCWIETVADKDWVLWPLAFMAMTVYTVAPLSAAGSVKLGWVRPEAAVRFVPSWLLRTV